MSKESISIVLAGEAGQGIQSIEFLLTKILKQQGYHLFATKEYMSRIRGGSNSTEIRVSSARVGAYTDQIDLLIPLDQEAIPHLRSRISAETIIIGEAEKLRTELPIHDLPFSKIAAAVGNPIFANTVAVGALTGLLEIDFQIVSNQVNELFSAKGEEIAAKNVAAAKEGYALGRKLHDQNVLPFNITANPDLANEIILNGSEAVALGAIAGGCNFCAAYPMSPATGVLIYLSQLAEDFGILVEQAEDEISAINMGIGAWYAGARAIVTTAGGGFALMTEGVSLAGMIESPLVIHIAGRPGPATGLPTRTEQGDLELALYAGHGEFPRIILAPGTLEEAFYLTQSAFNLADRFQVPVFILTDQFLVDSFYNLPMLDLNNLTNQPAIIETTADYQRYLLTEDGLSPRGIPGFGTGLVGADSDEHDQAGHITEDLDLRSKMVEKRLKKLEAIKPVSFSPVFAGPSAYRTLIIGWGTTYHPISEALALLDHPETGYLHFKQVYPLPPVTLNYLNRAEKIILVENNATGQFGKLLQLETGVKINHRILKYNGMPFSVEELVQKIKALL